MAAPTEKADVEIQPDSRLAANESLRCGAGGTPRPSMARLEAGPGRRDGDGGRSRREWRRRFVHAAGGPSTTSSFLGSRVRTLIYVCMHPHPWFEPILSSNVSITWGARTHTSRNGGPLVNSGPLPRPPTMFPGVRELARATGLAGRFRESDAGPTRGGLKTLPALWLSQA